LDHHHIVMIKLHIDLPLNTTLPSVISDSFNVMCFTGSLSCHSAGVVVEEGVVAVVLTEVVVVEVDSEGVVEVDSEGVVEVDSEGVEEVEVEVDLTDIKTLVHRNMLSVSYIAFFRAFVCICILLQLYHAINCIDALLVSAVGEFLHPCEDEIVCKCVTEENKVPYFNAPIYLENKEQIGKVDEIFGQIRDFVSLHVLPFMLTVLSPFTATSKLNSYS